MFNDLEWLRKNVAPIGDEKYYYRPFVLKDHSSNYNMFLVGINPATGIPLTINPEDYVKSLLNYNDFEKLYTVCRESSRDGKISKTRRGINSLVDWINANKSINVFETNIYPYPTRNEKELKNLPYNIKKNALRIFSELLEIVTPDILILHGSTPQKAFKDDHYKMGIVGFKKQAENEYIIKYKNGKSGIVFMIKHLMYYGKSGDSYSEIKNAILTRIKELP